jgi:hypothetical protein
LRQAPSEERWAREPEWRVRFYLGHRLPGGFWAGVSTYARRPHHAVRQAAHTTGGIGCVGFVVLAVVVALGIAYWYISVPVLVLTAIAVGVTVHRQHIHRAQAAASVPAVVARPAAVPIGAQPAGPRAANAAEPAGAPLPATTTTRHRAVRTPPLTMPADTFKVGSLVHLEKDGIRATYFVDHGRTPDEIVLKRVTGAPSVPDA